MFILRISGLKPADQVFKLARDSFGDRGRKLGSAIDVLCSIERINFHFPEFEEIVGEAALVRQVPVLHQPSIRYAEPRDKALYGILSSIRTLTLLDEHSPKKSTGDHHCPLMPIANAQDSLDIADSCDFEFLLGRLKFPNFHPPDGSSPKAFLRRLAMDGMRRRYDSPGRVIHDQIEEELSSIGEVGYEEYFLLWNHFHPLGIEWITRGSAADSLVCYCRRDLTDEFNMVIDIEHILPKSVFAELMFALFNLNISCKRCNMRIKKERTDFVQDLVAMRADWDR